MNERAGHSEGGLLFDRQNSSTPSIFLLIAPMLLPCTSAPAAGIGVNVTGTSLGDLPALNAGFQFIPPDTMGAIGPNRFVEFTNGSFSVYAKATGALVGSRISQTNFWINSGVTGLNN